MSMDPNDAPQNVPPGEYPPPPGEYPPPPSGYPPPPSGYPPSGEYPPPPGAAYPPPPGAAYPTPPRPAPGAGFDFQSLLQRYVTVLRNPSVATFSAELPYANWQAIWIGLVILGLADAIFGLIASVEVRSANVGGFVTSFIGAFIGFFILTGILYLSSKIFGGTGTFMPYAYLLSLIYVPLGVISAIAGIIPVLGALIALAAGIYEIYLAILATAAEQRLSMGRAAAAVLVPIAILFVLAIILIVTLGLAILAAMRFGG